VDLLLSSVANLVADTLSGGEVPGGEEDLGAEVCETDGQGAAEITAGGRDDHSVVVESHIVAPARGSDAGVKCGGCSSGRHRR
jgi:hypothetical protein